MSRAPPENIDMAEVGIGPDAGDRQDPPPPWSAQAQAWRGESNFVDSSGPIFSMYLEMAEEEDKKMAESWKADAEGILVFTGLFSAAVASLISVSLQDIRQNPQDTSNFYLANIYQLLADPDRPNISSSLPTFPPPFSPPTYAVWVNSLWFLSLVISITCALLATLLRQWARRYLKVTQARSSLHKRARIRSFFAEGVKKSHLSMVVEALPTLIHVSLSLFFAGLVVFLWNVNLTIFKLVLSWIGVCTAFYGCITFIPIFLRDSPYYSPLTPLARPVVVMILLVFTVLYTCLYVLVYCCSLCWKRCRGPLRIFGHIFGWFIHAMDMARMTPKEAALKLSSEIDTRAFTWTFDSLDEDHELERFFSGLPGFYNSKVLKEPLHGLGDQQKLRLLEAVIRLLDRTSSSNVLPDQVKRQRADICANAIELVDTPDAFPKILRRLLSEDGYGPLQSTQIVDFVRRWGDRNLDRKREYSTLDQAIFSIVIARVQQHDDAWFNLTSDQIGIPETALRSHAAHGDNLSLAILIYVTRQQFTHIRNPSWPSYALLDVLEAASKFNVEDTSPELQHEFCTLWNQVVRKAQNDSNWKISKRILKPIRHVYIRLHHNTISAPTLFAASTSDNNDVLDNPDTYPECNVTGHVHNGSASIIFPCPVPHDDASPSPVSPTSLDVPSFPLPAPFRVNETLTAPPPLDNTHSTHQAIDSLRVPVTSPDPATTCATRDFVTAGIKTRPDLTSESSTSTPLPSTSQPSGVSLQHNETLLSTSDLQILPSSASSNTVIDGILHTATTTPSISLGINSATDPAATPENHSNPIPSWREVNDLFRPSTVNRTKPADTMNTLEPPSPSLTPATGPDRAIAGRSPKEVNATNTGHRSPDPSRNQYEMV